MATRKKKGPFKLFSTKKRNDSQDMSHETTTSDQPQPSASSPTHQQQHCKFTAVVAVDFGTTYSGYAYAFTAGVNRRRVQVMSHRLSGYRGEGYGLQQPTVLLLTSEGHFHSFGYEAQQFYHDLDEYDAPNWLYFEKFKIELHSRKHLHEGMQLIAANGHSFPAVLVFAHSLNYFKHMCLQELRGQMLSNDIANHDIQWVITVPAIWRESAKQFMRKAAVHAGLIERDDVNGQLIIALEPEAASIYCQSLQLRDPDSLSSASSDSSPQQQKCHSFSQSSYSSSGGCSTPDSLDSSFSSGQHKYAAKLHKGVKYVVADCGGGTVDLTLHQMEEEGRLKELYKASGGAWGSIGVDYHFEMLLVSIFSQSFVEQFVKLYPVSWLELMNSFEAKKRYFDPSRKCASNIPIPFSFMESFRRTRRKTVEQAIMEYGDKNIQWTSQGNLRVLPNAMSNLFRPVVNSIVQHIHKVMSHPSATGIEYVFLVGGFSESPVLQQAITHEFGNQVRVVIPQDMSLCTIKGAVLFGLDTSIINVRHAALTYGVACLHKFDPRIHPSSKQITREGKDWCTDVFDTFVSTNQPVSDKKRITRHYNLASSGIKSTVISLFASDKEYNMFITDPGVIKVAELVLEVCGSNDQSRELKVTMDFSKTEVMVHAMDITTGKSTSVHVNFLFKQ